jgi:hypothetical protein
MAFRDMPDSIVPPSHLRCEAMTKPVPDTFQVWRRESHRCIRKATQSRAGHGVCALHASMPDINYWAGEVDNFRHRKFWRWPTKLAELGRAVTRTGENVL